MGIVRRHFLQASFAPQLFRFGELQILPKLDPCVFFIIPKTMGVDLKCQRMRSENVELFQIYESTPPVRVGRTEFYAGTMG